MENRKIEINETKSVPYSEFTVYGPEREIECADGSLSNRQYASFVDEVGNTVAGYIENDAFVCCKYGDDE